MNKQSSHDSLPGLDAFDASYCAAAEAFAAATRTGALTTKEAALIRLAVNASATTLHAPGIRRAIEAANAAGAEVCEMAEVLQLVSVIGIHACTVAMPILVEELRAAGLPEPAPLDASPHLKALKEDFTSRRGYWSDNWAHLLRASPEFFAAFTEFSSVPWDRGLLAPVMKEFVYIAMDAACTHLYQPGLRVHFRNALALGATPEQLYEVLFISSAVGLHTCEVAGPLLQEAARRRRLA